MNDSINILLSNAENKAKMTKEKISKHCIGRELIYFHRTKIWIYEKIETIFLTIQFKLGRFSTDFYQ